jgi:hypothetical protein
MGNKVLRYGFGAIALYLLVNYSTGSGSLISNGASGTVNVVKAFQGR